MDKKRYKIAKNQNHPKWHIADRNWNPTPEKNSQNKPQTRPEKVLGIQIMAGESKILDKSLYKGPYNGHRDLKKNKNLNHFFIYETVLLS